MQSILLTICVLILISRWLHQFKGTTKIYINICDWILPQKEHWEEMIFIDH